MKKYLSLVLLAFVVAVGSIVTPLVLPKDFLFSPSPATAQRADVRNGYAWLTLPSTGNQDDTWSCGANSAARVLAYYGHGTNYRDVRDAAQFEHGIIPTKLCAGSGILRTCVKTGNLKTGLEPNEVRSVLNNWEGGNAKSESGADLNKIKRLLSQGKPVIVLRRVGSIRPAGGVFGTWPAMHWVAVHGYSDQARKIYYTETEDGKAYEQSYDEFMSEWDWRIGDGLASETFHRKGVKPRTIVWVDRTPPSLASSPASPTMRVTICNRILTGTATYFLNSELKSMEPGKCGGYTLPVGSQFKTSYTNKKGERVQILVNLEGATYHLEKYHTGDISVVRQ